MHKRVVLAFGMWFAASVAHAAGSICTDQPLPGGDPSVAGATALQIELCHARRNASNDAAPLIVRAKTRNGGEVEFGAWTYELARVRIKFVSTAVPEGETATAFRQRTGAAFAINGGFFDFGPQHELRPVGLFIENRQVKNPLGRALSGTLLIAGRRLEILETSAVRSLQNYDFGLQSRPLLVDPGNRLGMRGNDNDFRARSAVCLPDRRHVTFFYAGRAGLSLFELATLLQAPRDSGGFACDVALNLDGGPSTQVAATDADGDPFERLGQNVVNAVEVFSGP